MFKLKNYFYLEESTEGADLSGGAVPDPKLVETAPVVEDSAMEVEVDSPASNEPDASPPVEDASTEPVVTELNDLYVGEHRVTVEVPAEIQTMLDDKGIDTNALLNEMYAQGNDFSLSDETRGKLEEAFGKTMVDGYLNLFKGQNEANIKAHQDAVTAQQDVLKEQYADFNELVGGDEAWGELAKFAETLPVEELDAFNSVMGLGAEHWQAQKAVLQTLIAKKNNFNQVDELTLLGGDGADQSRTGGSPTDKGYLTRQEYADIMQSEGLYDPRSYRNDPAKKNRVALLDSLRQEGIRKKV